MSIIYLSGHHSLRTLALPDTLLTSIKLTVNSFLDEVHNVVKKNINNRVLY